MIIKRDKTSDTQCNCLPPTDQYQTFLLKLDQPLFQITPSVYILGMMFSSFGPFRSPASSCAPSQFLLCTSSLVECETNGKKTFTCVKDNLVKSKVSVWYQHHSKSKTQHCSSQERCKYIYILISCCELLFSYFS